MFFVVEKTKVETEVAKGRRNEASSPSTRETRE